MAEEADTYVDDVASKIDSPGITLRPKRKNQVYNFDNDDDDDDFESEGETEYLSYRTSMFITLPKFKIITVLV